MQEGEGSNSGEADRSVWRQPKAVWAVAFACVVAFMGLGLVDPILPAIARQLDATPSQVELVFSSYFLVTGVAMLITGAVSSRARHKRTLLAGLAMIVIFSALTGSVGGIGGIVGFRAGWGLGNALFYRYGSGRDRRGLKCGDGEGGHPIRGRLRSWHLRRAPARRVVGWDQLAGAVLWG